MGKLVRVRLFTVIRFISSSSSFALRLNSLCPPHSAREGPARCRHPRSTWTSPLSLTESAGRRWDSFSAFLLNLRVNPKVAFLLIPDFTLDGLSLSWVCFFSTQLDLLYKEAVYTVVNRVGVPSSEHVKSDEELFAYLLKVPIHPSSVLASSHPSICLANPKRDSIKPLLLTVMLASQNVLFVVSRLSRCSWLKPD